MAQKVQLTTKQAKAMDSIKDRLGDEHSRVFKDLSTVIQFKLNEKYSFTANRTEADTISDVDFILALTVGYEVAKTAEEIVEDIIKKSMTYGIQPINHHFDITSYSAGIRRAFKELEKAGIQFTLKDE
ncbi:hypothetical protein [Bacillus subtilis]|uniref:hypothetical protein n=1 Tax=Bacillus subtilis TaxID=1423 RepID=UPI0011BD9924|nr:hypothetical protein [Bacillus subtilis]